MKWLLLKIVFAVDDPMSLDEAKDIVREVQARNTKKAPMLLVANKTDLCKCEEQWAAKESRIYALENRLNFYALSATNLSQVILHSCVSEFIPDFTFYDQTLQIMIDNTQSFRLINFCDYFK